LYFSNGMCFVITGSGGIAGFLSLNSIRKLKNPLQLQGVDEREYGRSPLRKKEDLGRGAHDLFTMTAIRVTRQAHYGVAS
jgi:hypothetical protein